MNWRRSVLSGVAVATGVAAIGSARGQDAPDAWPLLLDERFAAGGVGWKTLSGEWSTADGALTGAHGADGQNAFIVVFIATSQTGNRSTVDDIQVLAAESSSQHHHVPEPLIFVDKIGFRQVPKCFVDEDSG